MAKDASNSASAVNEIDLNPIYQAIKDLPYDGFVSHKDLQRAFGKPRPSMYDIEIKTDDEFRKAEAKWTWDYLETFTEARDAMLVDHKKMLVNVRGDGYRVLRPNEQVEASMSVLIQNARRIFSRAMREISHINDDLLTVEERTRAQLAQAKVGSIASLATNRRDLLPQK